MSLPGYDNWKTTDPDMEGAECPLCGDEVEGDKYEGACTNEECDYGYEADYEYLLEMRDN